jgi:Spy/CpxP family protein refolding chaperone
MKRRIVVIVVVAAMVAGTAFIAAAHGPGFGGKGHVPGMIIGRMARVLDLTAGQKEKVTAIIKAEMEKTQPLREQLFENREQVMEAVFSGKFDEAAVSALAAKQSSVITELMVSYARAGSEISALLTPEQRTLAKKLGPLMGPGPRHMHQFGGEE